jgi:hypothetical protein
LLPRLPPLNERCYRRLRELGDETARGAFGRKCHCLPTFGQGIAGISGQTRQTACSPPPVSAVGIRPAIRCFCASSTGTGCAPTRPSICAGRKLTWTRVSCMSHGSRAARIAPTAWIATNFGIGGNCDSKSRGPRPSPFSRSGEQSLTKLNPANSRSVGPPCVRPRQPGHGREIGINNAISQSQRFARPGPSADRLATAPQGGRDLAGERFDMCAWLIYS